MQKDKQITIANFHSLEELLSHHTEKYGDKDALIAYDPDKEEVQKITYKELYELVHKTAEFLSSNDIVNGDRFAILMHNSAEVLLFELAGALIGATTVPLDYKRDTLDRKIFKLEETDAKVLFIKADKSQNQEDISNIKKDLPKLKIFSWESFDEYLKIITEPLMSLRGAKRRGNLSNIINLPAQAGIASPSVRNDKAIVNNFESTYIILYTSGTTAHPKGAILSQRACLLNADGIAKWQKFTDSDRFNIILPLHHINSTIFCLSMILVGGTIILNSRYSASRFWEVVSKFNATNTSVVPTILHDLLVRFEEFKNRRLDISSLKRICIGSAPVLPEETVKFYKTFGVRVVQGYGQTETALRVAGVPIDVNEESYIEMVKNNTIGFPLANNELAIIDKDNRFKKEGEEGEICIKGPVLADGYLNDEEATKHSFKNSWFHSGDLGKYKIINGGKFYFIIGRIREIIIKGGVNLSPSAIEDALLKTFPEIDEVAVIGYPDIRMGEEIAVAIVPKKDLTLSEVEKLKEKIVSSDQNKLLKSISIYEMPKQVYVLDDLPKTSTGKIQRVIVKKIIAEMMDKEVTKRYFVRKINSRETEILKQTVVINNSRFLGLPATLSEFQKRAENGILWGAFEEKKGLVGSISCLRIDNKKLEAFKTWREATVRGTLSNFDKNGDTMLCVAISIRSDNRKQITDNKIDKTFENKLNESVKKYIKSYVNSGRDHIINFHMKPKGGLPGAKVWKILPDGRKDDKDSMGYNVLMKYPLITKEKKITRSHNVSPAVMLIEEALYFAWQNDIKNVIAFSRPAGFREYLLAKLKFHK